MRVCVVEDESAVRAGIIHKLNGLKKHLQVFDVQFGLEALEKIRFIRPDLIITDIMMPDLDGLELLRIVKQEMPRTKVVLLSGYNEFEYARKGLKYGADNYLLKPLHRGEMLAVIEELEAEQTQQLQCELAEHIQRLTQYGISIEIEDYISPSLWFNETIPKRLIVTQFGEAGSEALEMPEKTVALFTINHRVDALIVECEVGDEGVFYQSEQFTTALIEALEQWDAARFMDNIPHHRNPDTDHPSGTSSTEELRCLLVAAMRERNVQQLGEYLPLFFEHVESLPLKQLRKECALLMVALDESLMSKEQIAFIEEDQFMYWLSWVMQFSDWSKLRKVMERFIIGGAKALTTLEPNQHNGDIVKRAIQIVMNQRNEHLSLESVAVRLEIHPVTLSRMFKQQQGENFVHFVIRHKMQQAAALLVNTNKKICDIAEEIGYSDHRYFGVLFKKTYNMTPSEYRKTHARTHPDG